MKVSRILLYVKMGVKELRHLVHPRSVNAVRLEGRAVDAAVIRTSGVYLMCYVLIFFGSVLIVSIDNFDFTTNFTAIAATINNIGPGLNAVGPTGNFSQFSVLSKLVMMFDMLAGRLELFPMLVLASMLFQKRTGIWKDKLIKSRCYPLGSTCIFALLRKIFKLLLDKALKRCYT